MTLAAVALALDAVDGAVARRTGTATTLGARFDGEVDAFLIGVLSVYVGPRTARGCSRSAPRGIFLAGERLLPWMRAPLPPRRWRRVVAAMQGVVLTVAAAGVLPRTLTQVLLVAALVLLAASSGECTWWLWRRRDTAREAPSASAAAAHGVAVALTVLALLLVWVALVAPDQPSHLTLGAFARLPLELLVVVALAVLLPATPRRVLAVVVGAVLSVLVLVKVLDIGFFTAFDRPFKPVDDSSYVGIGIETLRDAVGRSSADLVVAVAAVLIVALLAVPVLALLRVTRVAAGHRGWALRAAAALGVVWVALRVVGAPVASSSAAALAVDEVQAVRTGLADRAALAARARPRPLPRHARRPAADRPAGQGRPARVRRELRAGRGPGLVVLAARRRRARPGHRAAAGRRLLVAQRLPHLADVRRPELAGAFHPAVGGPGRRPAALRPARPEQPPHPHPARSSAPGGGRSAPCRRTTGRGRRARASTTTTRSTTAATSATAARASACRRCPTSTRCWPCSAASSPAPPAAAVRRGRPHLEPRAVDAHPAAHPLGRGRRRLDLRPHPGGGVHAGRALRRRRRARAAYGHSIEYSLRTLFSFVQRYGDDNLVLVVLGDHQPATLVTGQGASHDVPISVIAHDPKVMRRIAGWGWQDGMLPSPQAPVWPMAAFRDRFLTAFGPSP